MVLLSHSVSKIYFYCTFLLGLYLIEGMMLGTVFGELRRRFVDQDIDDLGAKQAWHFFLIFFYLKYACFVY